MATQGPTICGTGADDNTVGTLTWTNPGNITALDTTYATVNVTLVNDQSHYIVGTNFGFTRNTGDTLLGILFEFRLSITALGGTVIVASAKACKNIGPRSFGTEKSGSETLTTTDTWYPYGGAADLCGLLGSTDFSDVTIGAALSAKLNLTPPTTIQCDACRMTITYAPAQFNPPPRPYIAQREQSYSERYEKWNPDPIVSRYRRRIIKQTRYAQKLIELKI